MSRILVTGAAGFIGSHLAHRLVDRGDEVVGLDSLNDYYSVQLKKDRLARLTPKKGFTFEHLDLSDEPGMKALFAKYKFHKVVNLAVEKSRTQTRYYFKRMK